MLAVGEPYPGFVFAFLFKFFEAFYGDFADFVGGCGSQACAQVPGVEFFLEAGGVGLNQGEDAQPVGVVLGRGAGFALFAGKAGGPEVDAVQAGEFCGVGWVGAERAELVG